MSAKAKQSRKRRSKAKKSRLGIWTALVLVLLVASYLAVLELSRPHVAGDRLRLDVLVDLAERGRIQDARILDVDSYLEGTYLTEDESLARYNAPYLKDGRERLVDILLENRVATTVDQQTSKRIANLATILLPGLIITLLFIYLILSSRRGTGLFAIRSGARRITPEEGGVSFVDVAGQDTAIAELKEIKEFLADPERFAAMGAQIPKGVLLYGPPGCGKTMLARALATEAGASFFSISGSDFVELYVGVGASRVRDLFRQARENAPALIFIDELDSVGRARGMVGVVASHQEQEQALNQILAEMDGFSTSDGIMVIGATNRPDVLDPALLRPGRFDRSIGIDMPDENARLAILAVHARNKKLDPAVDLAKTAHEAIGLTAADLASVMNESALFAARAGKPAITPVELNEALQRILEAPERQRRLSLKGKSIGRRFTDTDRVTFADVAGQDRAVTDLQEIREFLTHPERFAAVGSVIPRGVLLFGPPGCGKTLLARALAGEANAAFFSVGASEFVEVFAGVGASRVRDVFSQARAMAPAIVFIDEIDAIGRSRGGNGPLAQSQGGEQEQALGQILAEMDGFAPAEGVIVLAATNRPDTLDPALLRPGRFDRTIPLALPDEGGRHAILALHARSRKLSSDVDLPAIARRAHGLTGADLANVMNEAGILTVRADKEEISQAELDGALHRLLRAPGEQRRLAMRSRSVGRRYAPEERVTFADVAGVDDAIEELAEVREYLAAPERFARMGARVPRGILLSGPPGCGKTLLARAVAGESNAAFFSVSGSEFVEVFVGEGAARVRDLFGEARAMAPSIVFIDEIDAVGGHRAAVSSDGRGEVERTLNQLLVELDGFETTSAVIVMAATNRPDMLDAALVRPGRFDRHVTLSVPDRAGRRAILALHAKERSLAEDVDLDKVAALTRGFSGADLANVVNEAALLATRRELEGMTMAVLEEAIDRSILGVASRGLLMSEEERRLVAYHEAGHALVAHAVPGATPPHKLTIVPRGGSLGHCTMLDGHDRVVLLNSMLMGQMAVLLGGMVAEDLFCGESSSGTASDLQRVAEIARRMVRDYGMSAQLGPLAYRDDPGTDGRSSRAYSEDSGRAIDDEVRRLVAEAAEMARSILAAPSCQLDAVAEALLERETVSGLELEEMAARPAEPRPTALAEPETALRSGRRR